MPRAILPPILTTFTTFTTFTTPREVVKMGATQPSTEPALSLPQGQALSEAEGSVPGKRLGR